MRRVLFIDGDTILYSSAANQQKNGCISVNKHTGDTESWESKTAFNKWLANQDKYDKDDFTFQVSSVLIGRPEFAFKAIKQKVDNIFNASYCDEFFVCIQGSGNFRNDYVTPHIEYKGHRVAKPILFQECFDYTVRKYGSRCIVSNGVETDDFVNIKAWESYNKGVSSKNKADCPYVIAYCDKDIVANGRGWFLNYNKLEEGVFWNNADMQTRNFFNQVLTGDKADNVPGIIQLGEETKKMYGITTRGCGPASAERILGQCVNETHMARNVVEAYKDTYPNDWKERLADNCFFLYLQREEGEVFDVDKFFARYGITL